MLYQLLSLAGAALVLVAFIALQLGRMEREAVAFNVLNFLGSVFLGAVAIFDRRAGFIVLEVSWAIFSLVPLVRRKRGPTAV